MLKYILSAGMFITCFGSATAVAVAQGRSDEARPAKTETDRASQTGQENRAPQADARENNRDEDNASDNNDQRRKFEKLNPVDARPLETMETVDPCPKPEDCI